jgi:hypothetical protein
MFYLSKHMLNELYHRGSLLDQAKQSNDSNSSSSSLIQIKQRPLFEIKYYHELNESEYNILSLFDGVDSVIALVNKKTAFDCNSKSSNSKEMRKLEKGAVFQLYYYSFVNINTLLNESNQIKSFCCESNVIQRHDIIVIENFSLIGTTVCEDDQQLVLAEMALSLNNKNFESNNISTKVSISNSNNEQLTQISNIDQKINVEHLEVRALLVSISKVRDFNNRNTGTPGKVKRFLFKDSSGFIEAVIFNDLCLKYDSEKYKVDNYYIIKNVGVNLAKSALKAWPNQVSSNYELTVNKKTLIDETNPPTSQELCKEMEKENKPPKFSDGRPENTTFIPLIELNFKTPNSFVDIVGIVCKEFDITTIKSKRGNKEDLLLKNIEIMDTTISSPIKVALWGNQAKEFVKNVGQIFLFQGIQLSNYGGISLSVHRTTGMQKITGYYNVYGVEKLSMWWRSNKSIYIGKRQREEDENDEMHKTKLQKV